MCVCVHILLARLWPNYLAAFRAERNIRRISNQFFSFLNCDMYYKIWRGGYVGGESLRFTLLKFIREERKFSSLDELKKQLEKDKKAVELYC